MKRVACTVLVVLSAWFCLTPLAAASSDAREIDSAHSTITVRVYKSGFLSAFGHNHEIQAPIQSGQVKESGDLSVVLRVDALKLRVLDPEASESTRAQIQETMLGAQVLDADRFPEIRFQSTEIEPRGLEQWIVHGNLTLHGTQRPVSFEVILKGGHYRGSVPLKQTDFGIKPVTVAGGTVKVKDEVKIEFEIALMK
ncbi:MAG TPA: YceI family protein [Candidatus Acidoferrum sp.]|jgi:polyisoprenoid-binding protein YceI|nr:YceI family protein [Candidatus Acidoferrum sp.]